MKKNALRFCTGDCGEGLKGWLQAVMEALGDPTQCNDQSIIDLLCSINTTLAPEGDIYTLLEDIFDAIPNCAATGAFAADGFVEYADDQPVRITGIHSYFISDDGPPAGIIVEIGTYDGTTFNVLNTLVGTNPDSEGNVVDYQTNFTYPVLVTPPTGERVAVRAYLVGGDVTDGIPLNVFSCIEEVVV
ncbi:MAG: hypothetical protein GX209_06075 [Epulopiscium sp.]|nr:hypothetical protein [Candidatus Epulonipiscium sp.]